MTDDLLRQLLERVRELETGLALVGSQVREIGLVVGRLEHRALAGVISEVVKVESGSW